jgi:DNA topoisomerase-1
MSRLLIVESPAKCKKIAEFLGAGWRVRATMGHIRALKEDLSAIGFDAAASPTPAWRPTYEQIASKSDAIAALRREATTATEIFLGSDDDREGEAIAWHVCVLLGRDPATTPRVVFHEITAPALRAAVAAPRRIDMAKFNAQQARTMLDMLIGFTLSPCLWRGVGFKPGLSAGRCQTPALRLVYDRDAEISAHTATPSWRLTVKGSLEWRAETDLPDEPAADAALRAIAAATPPVITIRERQERVATSSAPEPFITSSLQQEASSRLGMAPKATMRAAQTLYEGGHITYMRTDNAILSEEAREAAAAVVRLRWGEEYLAMAAAEPAAGAGATKKKVVRRKKAAATPAPAPAPQAAHEGIRPTHLETTELADVSPQEQRLYDLIWRRTVQSVMAPERRDVVRLVGAATTTTATAPLLHTTWNRTAFAGWRVLDADAAAEAADSATYETRRALQPASTVPWTIATAEEHRTAPPSRYTEASLIRELEYRGIGRPSTYATLVETVLERGYVEKNTAPPTPTTMRGLEVRATSPTAAPRPTTRTERTGGERDKLHTTALGRTVAEWLGANFGDVVAYNTTARMEAQLDEVARGTRDWPTVLTEAWTAYRDRYNAVMVAKPTGGATASSRSADYGDGYKMVVSRKGPLFVLEREGEKTRFAPVPATLSLQTATRADAEVAFATASTAISGDHLGDLDGDPVVRRKGPYGFYAQWRTARINCKPTDTLTDLSARLMEKAAPPAADAVDRQVGPYRIRRGPYGLYMFKQTEGSRKPVFVGIPPDTPWATLTPETAEQVYKLAAATKRAAAKPRATKKASGVPDDDS